MRILVPALAAAFALSVAGCSSSGDEGTGSTLRNLLLYGGTTVPPAAPKPTIDVADCPPVTVPEGGAALRTLSGGQDGTVRSQLSIANVARECTGRPDGAVIVKVGVEGRALVGPGGGIGRFDTPVTIVLKRGDQVLATRTRRVAVAIPPGQYEQTFVVVENDLVVPAGTGEFEIEVGLGNGGAKSERRPARKTRQRG